MFEMGTRHAFHRLMADAAKPYGWTLIAEQEKKVAGKTIRPDGTFKDEMNLVRGCWKAKDTTSITRSWSPGNSSFRKCPASRSATASKTRCGSAKTKRG